MPYIKKIELKGFKSFGPQGVKVALDKGFTVITGPNGSGKTNILDAFLFSLGELSTRRLRAETAAKLIFHGSEKAGLERAKMAKVIIQFDNSDGRMPVDTATVTISREVYRNGQSVYRLNGRRISRAHSLEDSLHGRNQLHEPEHNPARHDNTSDRHLSHGTPKNNRRLGGNRPI